MKRAIGPGLVLALAWAQLGVAAPAGRKPGGVEYQQGAALFKGEGGARDLRGAAQKFLDAAKLGHMGGQFMLGRAFLKGEGVAKNPQKGWAWVQKAADQGHPKAVALLAKRKAHQEAKAGGKAMTGGAMKPGMGMESDDHDGDAMDKPMMGKPDTMGKPLTGAGGDAPDSGGDADDGWGRDDDKGRDPEPPVDAGDSGTVSSGGEDVDGQSDPDSSGGYDGQDGGDAGAADGGDSGGGDSDSSGGYDGQDRGDAGAADGGDSDGAPEPTPPPDEPPEDPPETGGFRDDDSTMGDGGGEDEQALAAKGMVPLRAPTDDERSAAPGIRTSLEGMNDSIDADRVAELEAQAKDNAWSAFHLGFLYESGVGVSKDLARAKQLYTDAAHRGYVLANVFLEDLGK